MAIDISPVTTALLDVGIAVASVAVPALLVAVMLKCYKWLEWPLYVRERRREEAEYQKSGKLWP